MEEPSTVWDLGEVTDRPAPRVAKQQGAPDRPARSGSVHGRRPSRHANEIDWIAGFAMVAPGVPDLLRGRRTTGLFFLSMFGFVGALGWAVFATLDRLAPTLVLLGLPPESAVWALGGLFAIAVSLHLANVATSDPARLGAPPSPVAALSSALVPGWGQLLNGDVARAMVFAAGAWTVAGMWVLASPWLGDLLAARNLVLPPVLTALTSPPARWAATAVVSALAVYDAWERAARIRDS